MGNAGGEFAEACHFFGLDELGLGRFQIETVFFLKLCWLFVLFRLLLYKMREIMPNTRRHPAAINILSRFLLSISHFFFLHHLFLLKPKLCFADYLAQCFY